MAICAVFDVVGMTQDQYYQVFNEVTDHGRQQPPGALTHVAGPTDAGFCVIETWESEEALQQFFETQLGRSLAAANVGEVQPKIITIVNTLP